MSDISDRLKKNSIFRYIFIKGPMSNFKEICRVGAALTHAQKRTDLQDVTKITGDFSNNGKAPKKFSNLMAVTLQDRAT